MKKRLVSYGVAAAAMLGVMSILLVSAPAQNRAAAAAKADTKPTPRMPDGHPDFTGYYLNNIAGVSNAQPGEQVTTKTADGSIFFAYGGAIGGVEAAEDGNTVEEQAERDKNPAPYKPEYQAKVNELFKYSYGPRDNLKDPNLDCKPAGPMREPLGIMQVLQHPTAITFLYEAAPGQSYRIIYLDGRKHPDNFDSSYMGHSIGHWEGDTLVVDTVGLNDETWMGNVRASLHSDKVHMIERFSRQGDTLTYQQTIEDPVMFTKPWVRGAQRIRIGPADDYIQPQMCVGLTKAHQQVNTPQDTFKCNWCNPASLYGEQSGELTVPKDAPSRAGGE
jgi:hypothetical protein